MLLTIGNSSFSFLNEVTEGGGNSLVSLLDELDETILRGVGEVKGLDDFSK